MQSKQLDAYIATLGERLKSLTPLQREEELREVRQHMEALTLWHMQQGKSPDDATRLAIQQFGRAERIGRDLNHVSAQTQKLTARVVARYFCFWLGIAALQFLFFSSMNDKPTDFPYTVPAKLLLSMSLASFALCGHHLYQKFTKRQVL